MHPRSLSILDFTYDLPDDRIARYPLEHRDASKLLVYRRGQITEDVFACIGNHLPEGSLLVFNNSKVVEARLLFKKDTGGIIEVFALEPHERYPDITTAMHACGTIAYKCLIGGASKWKHGMVLQKSVKTQEGEITLEARISERRPDCFVIDFSWEPENLPFAALLHAMGQIPIPPYLHREAEASDAERYQTIYAREEGSVAAPTAGLHFTQNVLNSLPARHIETTTVTLHVGAGTFMPVKAGTMAGHAMHVEYAEVEIACLRRIRSASQVIPVGTTSMRTLESLYWVGRQVLANPDLGPRELAISQWEPYDTPSEPTVTTAEALDGLIHWLERQQRPRLSMRTQIMIAPGYSFRVCQGLITNFHQPQSTLLLLVAALLGSDWRRVYQFAMDGDFRFLSYGDSSLLLP